MRLRMLPVAAAAAITLTALPAHAAPSAVTFTDPAGDWAVASQDVVRVAVQTARRGAERVLSVDISLAAPVGAAWTMYMLGFRHAGTCYGLEAETFNGAPAGYSAGGASAVPAVLSAYSCDAYGPQTPPTAPATVTVNGASVRITADYALGLRPGLLVQDIGVAVGTEPTQSSVYVGSKGVTPQSGDFALTPRLLTLR